MENACFYDSLSLGERDLSRGLLSDFALSRYFCPENMFITFVP